MFKSWMGGGSSSSSKSTRRKTESKSTSSRKSSQSDDRDRGLGDLSVYSPSSRSKGYAPSAADESVASTYVTAEPETIGDYERPIIERTPKPRNTERDSKSSRGRDRDRSPSLERNKRKNRTGMDDIVAGDDDLDRERDRRERRRTQSGDQYDPPVSTTMPSSSPSAQFAADISAPGFSQFPMQDIAMPPASLPSGHDASPAPYDPHVHQQFPGQFPSVVAEPYHPPNNPAGAAADYYGDQGQSVAEQPGVRPDRPPIIPNSQAHLMPASPSANPPPEPSSIGQVGAAAAYYADEMEVSENTPSADSSKPPKPSKPGKPSKPTKPSSSAIPAAAAGAVAYGVGSGMLSHGQSESSSTAAAQQSTSYSQPAMTSSGKPPHSPGVDLGIGATTAAQQSTSHSQPAMTSGKPPHSPGIGAGIGVAAAGATAAYMMGHHHSSPGPAHSSQYTYQNYEESSQGGPPSYGYAAHGNGGYPHGSGALAVQHRRRGPLRKFVDFWRDPYGVGRFEDYTETIGVCKYCFEPGTSSLDAPRRHHYHPRRHSADRYSSGSSSRVNKPGRHMSSRSSSGHHSMKDAALGAAAGSAAMAISKSRERNRNRSPSRVQPRKESSDSSLVNLSRSEINAGGGLGSFFTASSENRKKRRSKKNRGFFSFNSSSSSLDADLAFGKGFAKKSKSSKLKKKGKKDENVDAALLGLGAAATALAASPNDRRSTGQILVAKETRSRHSAYASSATNDDNEWVDADSEDQSSSVSSTLAFGGSSADSASDSSASGWGWSWGKKKKKDKRSSATDAALAAGAGALGGAALASASHHRDSRASSSVGSLQHVIPVPTSDPSRFDIARVSPSVLFGDQPPLVHPGSIPLQQPQPVAPVSQAVYTTQGGLPGSIPAYSAPPVPPIFANDYEKYDYRFRQSHNDQPYFDRRQTVVPRPPRRSDSSPVFPTQESAGSTLKRRSTTKDQASVQFDLTEEQAERERRLNRRERKRRDDSRDEPAPLIAREELDRQDSEHRSRRRRDREKEKSQSDERDQSSSSWIGAAAAGAIGGAAASTVFPLKTEDEEASAARQRRREERRSERRRTSENQAESIVSRFDAAQPSDVIASSSTSQEDQEKQAPRTTTSRPVPVYEDYAVFFAPEGLQHSPDDSSDKRDSTGVGKIVEVEPARDRFEREALEYPRESYEQQDHLPWPVPRLNIIEPTPPQSLTGSDVREPTAAPVDTSSDAKPCERTTTGSRVSWGEHSMHEYEVPSSSEQDPLEHEHIPEASDKDFPPVEEAEPKNTSSKPGADIEFAATIAAATEAAGFDADLVIDDPSYHTRSSPPGSEDEGTYTTAWAGPSSWRKESHGFVEGEVETSDPEEIQSSAEQPNGKHDRASSPDNDVFSMPGGFDAARSQDMREPRDDSRSVSSAPAGEFETSKQSKKSRRSGGGFDIPGDVEDDDNKKKRRKRLSKSRSSGGGDDDEVLGSVDVTNLEDYGSQKQHTYEEIVESGKRDSEKDAKLSDYNDDELDKQPFLGEGPEMPAADRDESGASGLSEEAETAAITSGDDAQGRSDPSETTKEQNQSRRQSMARSTDSPTAVPLHFRRPRSSPGLHRSAAPGSPEASSPGSPNQPRHRRLNSTEFRNSREIRPLFLVERHNAAKTDPEPGEPLPSLPSSRTSSPPASIDGLRSPNDGDGVMFWETVELSQDIMAKRRPTGLAISTSRPKDSDDLLDSQQATPTAETFGGEASTKMEKPKYEFHSPSELLQDPRVYAGLPLSPTIEALPSAEGSMVGFSGKELITEESANEQRPPVSHELETPAQDRQSPSTSYDVAKGVGFTGIVDAAVVAAAKEIDKGKQPATTSDDKEISEHALRGSGTAFSDSLPILKPTERTESSPVQVGKIQSFADIVDAAVIAETSTHDTVPTLGETGTAIEEAPVKELVSGQATESEEIKDLAPEAIAQPSEPGQTEQPVDETPTTPSSSKKKKKKGKKSQSDQSVDVTPSKSASREVPQRDESVSSSAQGQSLPAEDSKQLPQDDANVPTSIGAVAAENGDVEPENEDRFHEAVEEQLAPIEKKHKRIPAPSTESAGIKALASGGEVSSADVETTADDVIMPSQTADELPQAGQEPEVAQPDGGTQEEEPRHKPSGPSEKSQDVPEQPVTGAEPEPEPEVPMTAAQRKKAKKKEKKKRQQSLTSIPDEEKTAESEPAEASAPSTTVEVDPNDSGKDISPVVEEAPVDVSTEESKQVETLQSKEEDAVYTPTPEASAETTDAEITKEDPAAPAAEPQAEKPAAEPEIPTTASQKKKAKKAKKKQQQQQRSISSISEDVPPEASPPSDSEAVDTSKDSPSATKAETSTSGDAQAADASKDLSAPGAGTPPTDDQAPETSKETLIHSETVSAPANMPQDEQKKEQRETEPPKTGDSEPVLVTEALPAPVKTEGLPDESQAPPAEPEVPMTAAEKKKAKKEKKRQQKRLSMQLNDQPVTEIEPTSSEHMGVEQDSNVPPDTAPAAPTEDARAGDADSKTDESASTTEPSLIEANREFETESKPEEKQDTLSLEKEVTTEASVDKAIPTVSESASEQVRKAQELDERASESVAVGATASAESDLQPAISKKNAKTDRKKRKSVSWEDEAIAAQSEEQKSDKVSSATVGGAESQEQAPEVSADEKTTGTPAAGTDVVEPPTDKEIEEPEGHTKDVTESKIQETEAVAEASEIVQSSQEAATSEGSREPDVTEPERTAPIEGSEDKAAIEPGVEQPSTVETDNQPESVTEPTAEPDQPPISDELQSPNAPTSEPGEEPALSAKERRKLKKKEKKRAKSVDLSVEAHSEVPQGTQRSSDTEGESLKTEDAETHDAAQTEDAPTVEPGVAESQESAEKSVDDEQTTGLEDSQHEESETTDPKLETAVDQDAFATKETEEGLPPTETAAKTEHIVHETPEPKEEVAMSAKERREAKKEKKRQSKNLETDIETVITEPPSALTAEPAQKTPLPETIAADSTAQDTEQAQPFTETETPAPATAPSPAEDDGKEHQSHDIATHDAPARDLASTDEFVSSQVEQPLSESLSSGHPPQSVLEREEARGDVQEQEVVAPAISEMEGSTGVEESREDANVEETMESQKDVSESTFVKEEVETAVTGHLGETMESEEKSFTPRDEILANEPALKHPADEPKEVDTEAPGPAVREEDETWQPTLQKKQKKKEKEKKKKQKQQQAQIGDSQSPEPQPPTTAETEQPETLPAIPPEPDDKAFPDSDATPAVDESLAEQAKDFSDLPATQGSEEVETTDETRPAETETAATDTEGFEVASSSRKKSKKGKKKEKKRQSVLAQQPEAGQQSEEPPATEAVEVPAADDNIAQSSASQDDQQIQAAAESSDAAVHSTEPVEDGPKDVVEPSAEQPIPRQTEPQEGQVDSQPEAVAEDLKEAPAPLPTDASEDVTEALTGAPEQVKAPEPELKPEEPAPEPPATEPVTRKLSKKEKKKAKKQAKQESADLTPSLFETPAESASAPEPESTERTAALDQAVEQTTQEHSAGDEPTAVEVSNETSREPESQSVEAASTPAEMRANAPENKQPEEITDDQTFVSLDPFDDLSPPETGALDPSTQLPDQSANDEALEVAPKKQDEKDEETQARLRARAFSRQADLELAADLFEDREPEETAPISRKLSKKEKRKPKRKSISEKVIAQEQPDPDPAVSVEPKEVGISRPESRAEPEKEESSLSPKASKKKAKKAKKASLALDLEPSTGNEANQEMSSMHEQEEPARILETKALSTTPKEENAGEDEWPAIEWEESKVDHTEQPSEQLPETEIATLAKDAETIGEFDESAIPAALQEATKEPEEAEESWSTPMSKKDKEKAKKTKRKSQQAALEEVEVPAPEPSKKEIEQPAPQPTPEDAVPKETPVEKSATFWGSKIASIFPGLERAGFRRSSLGKQPESLKDNAEEETAARDSAIPVSEAPIATNEASRTVDLPGDEQRTDPSREVELEPTVPEQYIQAENPTATMEDEWTNEPELPESGQTAVDRPSPAPMQSASKERSSILFSSSPSTRTELDSVSPRHSLPSKLEAESPSGLHRTPSVIHGHHQQIPRAWNLEDASVQAVQTSSPPRSLVGGDYDAYSPPRTPLDTIDEQEPGDGNKAIPRLEIKSEHVLPRPQTPVRKSTVARETWATPENEKEKRQKDEWADVQFKPSSSSSSKNLRRTQNDQRPTKALDSQPPPPPPPPRPDLDLDQLPSSSSYDPVTDKGKRPLQNMADVYEGWGETASSPRSPSRPTSVRHRRSIQHLQDLETRLDQLISENRLLITARDEAEDRLRNASVARRKSDQALNSRGADLRDKEAEVEQLKSSVEWLQKELSHLTQENEGLTASNAALTAAHAAEVQNLRESSTRELEDLRSQHTQLSTQLDDRVRQEIEGALAQKDTELRRLREELEDARDKVKELQQQIAASLHDNTLVFRDEDYFDAACQKLCGHVQQWVLRFSKHSDHRRCRLIAEMHDEKVADRFDNALLDGSDADAYLSDRVRRRDVFMSVVMTMVWEYIFTRYLFGMDREQRQKLKSLEKQLVEVGPRRAVHRWRATTLTLLSRRPTFASQRDNDTEAVALEIFGTLSRVLPPPSQVEAQLLESLRKVLQVAVNLSLEMRTQMAEFIMLPPLQPEYDSNGDLARQVYFNASLMNERSGETTSNEQLEAQQAVVRIVLFPLVVKKGNDVGEGDDEVVVCPAQVLVARPGKDKKVVRMVSGDRMSLDATKSVHSVGPPSVMDMSNVV